MSCIECEMHLKISYFTFILMFATFLQFSHDVDCQEIIYVPRTKLFARWPFFGSFRNVLRVVRPNVHVGRKSDFRSDFDENYINYHGAQLWKIIFNPDLYKDNITRTEQMQTFIELYGE